MSTKTMMQSEKKMGVRAVVQIGMLAAVAVILMLFEIPLPFAPSFYKIDFSEVPVLVGCFAMTGCRSIDRTGEDSFEFCTDRNFNSRSR